MGVTAARSAGAAWLLAAALGVAGPGCQPGVGRPAVSLQMTQHEKTPADASVYIDEEYVGPLGYVAARGVRLPVGEHRITITRDGYFPWDRLVEADRQPITLDVRMVPIPD